MVNASKAIVRPELSKNAVKLLPLNFKCFFMELEATITAQLLTTRTYFFFLHKTKILLLDHNTTRRIF